MVAVKCKLLHGKAQDDGFQTRSLRVLMNHLGQVHSYPPAYAERLACEWFLGWMETEDGNSFCGECGGPADERVKAGMKCAACSYGHSPLSVNLGELR